MRDLNPLRAQVGVWPTIGRALSDAPERAALGAEDMRARLPPGAEGASV